MFASFIQSRFTSNNTSNLISVTRLSLSNARAFEKIHLYLFLSTIFEYIRYLLFVSIRDDSLDKSTDNSSIKVYTISKFDYFDQIIIMKERNLISLMHRDEGMKNSWRFIAGVGNLVYTNHSSSKTQQIRYGTASLRSSAPSGCNSIGVASLDPNVSSRMSSFVHSI